MILLTIHEFLKKIFKDLFIVDITITILIFLLSFLISKILNFMFRVVLRPIFKRTKTELDDRILELIYKFDNRIFSILGLYLGINYFESRVKSETALKNLLSTETYNFLIGTTSLLFDLLFVALVIIGIYIFSKIFSLILDYYVEKKNIDTSKGTLIEFIPLLRKVFLLILIVLGLLVVLNKFNVNVSGIIVSLGVGSLAIALAAQETIANMIAGFIILIDRPFREGDRIKLETGELGDVYQIGMRSTKVLDFDNNLIIIPNSILVKSKIQNITYPDYVSRVVVDVEVAYNTNIELAKRILIDIASEHPLNLKEFEPLVFITNFTTNGISLRLISRTADYRNVYEIQSDLREEILKKFAEHKIEIPYQQIVIRKTQES